MLTYRTLFIAAILFVCFGAVFWGYLEYDRHKFQKSLPIFKSEPQTSKNAGVQTPAVPEAAEVPDLEKKPRRFAAQDNAPLNKANPSETEKQVTIRTDPPEKNAQLPDWATDTSSTEVLEHLWQDPNTSAINANEFSPAEYEVYYRDQLRKEYGNLPEIDIYVKLYRRFIDERKPITLDEQIQFLELAAFFYPSAENELGVQELKDRRDQVGGHVVIVPAEDISIEE